MTNRIETAAVMATCDKQVTMEARKVFAHLKVATGFGQFSEIFKESLKAADALAAGGHLSVVLLDLDMPDLNGDKLLSKLKALTADISLSSVVIIASNGEAALHAMRAGAEDYVLKPVRAEDLSTRIRFLEERRAKTIKTEFPSVDVALPHLVERLHDPSNGHLDARKVANFFGLTLAEVARHLGRGVSTVHKTPTAPALQDALRPFEAIASGLLRLTGSERRARMWLNSSDPALEGHAPIDWLRLGKLNDLASYVQDRLEGRPA